MTDEEKAEKYADYFWGASPSALRAIKQAYLAGLKVGREEKLHDLRKDPHDLPKDNNKKLCFHRKGKIIARYDGEYNCWAMSFNDFETIIPLSVIIAWCEIPKFDE